MINNKPCWKSPTPPFKLKKKSLIFADWTVSTWSAERISNTSEIINQLIDDGFAIFIWQNGKVKPWTHTKESDTDEEPDKITPCPHEVIINAAMTQCKLIRKQVLILDDHWLRAISSQKFDKPRQLNCSDLVYSIHDKKVILSTLVKASPKWKTIVHDEFSQDTNILFNQLIIDYPFLTIKKRYRKLNLSQSENFYHLIKNKELILENNLINWEQLKQISQIKLCSFIYAQQLEALLRLTERLQTLDLSKCIIKGDFNLNFNLDVLENLYLNNTYRLSISILQVLLLKSKNLKRLSFAQLELDGNFTIPALNLEAVEHLNISGSNLSESNLNLILSNLKTVKYLDLTAVHALDGLIKFLRLNQLDELHLASKLIQLEELVLSNIACSAQNLSSLIAQSKSLIYLNLSGIKLSGDFSQNLNLEFLENLDLSNTTISAKNLHSLVYKANNLRILNLQDCTIVGQLEVQLNLPELEILNLTKVKIIAHNLYYLLSNSCKLNNLNLDGSSIIGDFMQEENLNFKLMQNLNLSQLSLSATSLQCILANAIKLKVLSFSNLRISGELGTNTINLNDLETLIITEDFDLIPYLRFGLSALLAKSHKLKSLTLDGLELLSDENVDEEYKCNLDLGSVKNLTITRCLIAAETLEGCLESTRCLTYLDLSAVQIMGIFSQVLNLSKLKHLNLNRASISAINLQSLIANSPHLKTINLSDSNITGEFTAEFNFPSLTKMNLSSLAFSTANLYCLISNAAKLRNLNLQNYTDYTAFASRKEKVAVTNIKLNLSSLKDLNLVGADLPPDFVYNLFVTEHKALSSLNLSSYFISSIDSLQNLESLGELSLTLDLETAEKNAKLLLLALEAAPYLKKLTIIYKNKNNFRAHESSVKIIRLINERKTKGLIFCEVGDNTAPKIKLAQSEFWEQRILQVAAQNENFTSPTLINCLEPKAQRANSSLEVDADTTPVLREYQLNQIFIGKNLNPHPSKYRGSVYHRLELSPSPVHLNQAFSLNNHAEADEFDLQLQTVFIHQSPINLFEQFKRSAVTENTELFYGEMTLILDAEWQTLRSLSSTEKILVYHLSGDSGSHEIKYSLRDNIYYIRATDGKSQTVQIDFLLETWPQENKELAPALKQLINNYIGFKEGGHSFKGPGTGQIYLNAINAARKGACRHRAVALMDAIQNHKKEYGFPDSTTCRFITNDCHAFVEIKTDKNSPWLAYDLGGYAAELKINQNQTERSNQTEEKPFQSVPEFEELPKIKIDFERRLETWKKEKKHFNSSDAYVQHLVSGFKPKQLIELSSSDDVLALSLAIESQCQRLGRPVFYIHSAEELICSSNFIEKIGDQGIPRAGEEVQAGSLHDFLTRKHSSANPPILIVNYDRFDDDQIVATNTLIDINPNIDGVALPNSMVVIGLINPDKADCYQGDDFYSRFGTNNIETCPLSGGQIFSKPKLEPAANFKGKLYPINLFRDKNWQKFLLGQWIIKKDKLVFKDGELLTALKSGLLIDIQNGLWEDDNFCHFWERAITLGYIECFGEKIAIHQTNFSRSEGYDWPRLKRNFTLSNELTHGATVLNPTLLSQYFSRYECDNDTSQLDTVAGLIEAHENNKFTVHLTRALNENEWARLLNECDKFNVDLHCYCASAVDLPRILAEHPLPNATPSYTPLVIETTDIDLSLSQLVGEEVWQIIDVSELTSADLLYKLNGHFNKDNLSLEFHQSENALEVALENGNKVILKGQFSLELADALAPLLLDMQGGRRDGKLLVVSEDVVNLNYLASKKHWVTTAEKCSILKQYFTQEQIDSLEQLETEPLSKLQARLIHPQADPWQGMHSLPGTINLQDFDEVNSNLKTQEFISKRLNDVNAILEKSPYVLLTGLTGVGKSSFVEKHLAKEPNTKVYNGEFELLAWAKDKSNLRKILFWDEANTLSKEYSEFEGLYANPPQIWIDRESHLLDGNHKAAFAANPLSEGGERKVVSFFERHGSAIVFEPLPQEFIYDVILNPIFAQTLLENHSLVISRELLKVYRFLCENSNDEVLISPREVQMMALLILSHMVKNPQAAPILVSKHYAYQLAQSLVPKAKRKSFEKLFHPPALTVNSFSLSKEFTLTPSRKPLYQLLDDMNSLAHYRQNNPQLNEAQLYGGLIGIFIEGEPGSGKSSLGKEQKNDSQVACHYLPVSMQTEDKDRLIIQAFDKGERLIIDEINCAPLNERLHNSIAGGRKLDGSRPEKPGFYYIATGNPPTRAGRNKANTAVDRRRIKHVLPPYSPLELKTILTSLGLDAETIDYMIWIYQNKFEQAKHEYLSPAPTQRDLFDAAAEWLKTLKTKEEKFATRLIPINIDKFNVDKLASVQAPRSAGFFAQQTEREEIQQEKPRVICAFKRAY